MCVQAIRGLRHSDGVWLLDVHTENADEVLVDWSCSPPFTSEAVLCPACGSVGNDVVERNSSRVARNDGRKRYRVECLCLSLDAAAHLENVTLHPLARRADRSHRAPSRLQATHESIVFLPMGSDLPVARVDVPTTVPDRMDRHEPRQRLLSRRSLDRHDENGSQRSARCCSITARLRELAQLPRSDGVVRAREGARRQALRARRPGGCRNPKRHASARVGRRQLPVRRPAGTTSGGLHLWASDPHIGTLRPTQGI